MKTLQEFLNESIFSQQPSAKTPLGNALLKEFIDIVEPTNLDEPRVLREVTRFWFSFMNSDGSDMIVSAIRKAVGSDFNRDTVVNVMTNAQSLKWVKSKGRKKGPDFEYQDIKLSSDLIISITFSDVIDSKKISSYAKKLKFQNSSPSLDIHDTALVGQFKSIFTEPPYQTIELKELFTLRLDTK